MKKGIQSTKKRRALAAKGKKRSERSKKILSKKHLRRVRFENERAEQKYKEEKAFSEFMTNLEKSRNTGTQSFQ